MDGERDMRVLITDAMEQWKSKMSAEEMQEALEE